jgi:hypothetical protein
MSKCGGISDLIPFLSKKKAASTEAAFFYLMNVKGIPLYALHKPKGH